jgi:hypothetical protein
MGQGWVRVRFRVRVGCRKKEREMRETKQERERARTKEERKREKK